MNLVGIDMGVETTKVVVLSDNQIVGYAKEATGGIDRPAQAQKAYEKALAAAGITSEDVFMVSATGKGKYDVPFAERRVTETIAAAHAARFLCADATAVISIGADEIISAALTSDRLVSEFVLNQKCAAGIGLFLSKMAYLLNMSVSDLHNVNIDEAITINDNCPVFAELDILGMLNNGVPRKAIAAACVKAAAVRAAATPEDLTVCDFSRTVLFGGVALNSAFVSCLESIRNIKFIVPQEAEYAGAIGAALSCKKGISL